MRRDYSWFVLFTLLAVVVLGFFLGGAVGCAATHPAATPAIRQVFPAPGETPHALKAVATGLNWFILLSVVVAGVSIGLFFALPADHNISIPVAASALGVEAVSLVTRVSLWVVPYLAFILGVVALVALIYEIVRNTSVVTDVETVAENAAKTGEGFAGTIESKLGSVGTEVKNILTDAETKAASLVSSVEAEIKKL
jgi:hypothetical protein